MAKKSALDAKVAEIDTMMAACHEELNRLRGVRAFLTGRETAEQAEAQAAPKAKRTRGKAKAKPGLPADGEAQS